MANFLYNGVVVTSREGTMSMSYDLLQLGIALSQSGRKQEANEIFGTLIHNDRFNETAWIWFIFTLETDPEKIAGLEEFLTVFPIRPRQEKRLLLFVRRQSHPCLIHNPLKMPKGRPWASLLQDWFQSGRCSRFENRSPALYHCCLSSWPHASFFWVQ
jgi:hypothetical protein